METKRAMLIQSLRDSERPLQSFTFKAIPEDAIPLPDFPDWDGSKMTGLSPRSAQRLKLLRILPLPDTPLVRKFLRWRRHPVKFTFQTLEEKQWQLLTKADSSMLLNSLEYNGFPHSSGSCSKDSPHPPTRPTSQTGRRPYLKGRKPKVVMRTVKDMRAKVG